MCRNVRVKHLEYLFTVNLRTYFRKDGATIPRSAQMENDDMFGLEMIFTRLLSESTVPKSLP